MISLQCVYGTISLQLLQQYAASSSLRAGFCVLERVKGIEPSYAAWEAAVLPLNYTRDWRHSTADAPPPSSRAC